MKGFRLAPSIHISPVNAIETITAIFHASTALMSCLMEEFAQRHYLCLDDEILYN